MRPTRELAVALLCLIATAVVTADSDCLAPSDAQEVQGLEEAMANAGLPPLAELIAQEAEGAAVSILAPTDAAFLEFEAARPNLGQEELASILRGHILLEPPAGRVYRTLLDGFNVTYGGSGSMLYNEDDYAQLLSSTALCGNGFAAGIDVVMVPAVLEEECKSPYEIIEENPDLFSLLQLTIQTAYPEQVPADINAIFNGDSPGHILTPANPAMMALAEKLGISNPAEVDLEFIRRVLTAHIITDSTFDQAAAGPQTVTTVGDEEITVDLTEQTAQWEAPAASITEVIETCNGAMYTVDSVLLPAELPSAPDASPASPTPPTTEEESGLDTAGARTVSATAGLTILATLLALLLLR